MAEIACRIAPGPKRVALTVEAGQWAKCGVFMELLGAVVGVEYKHKVIVSYITAGGIDGLKREAATVRKASYNRPAGSLFLGSGVRRRGDLCVDDGAGVCDVACRVTRCGYSHRDRRTGIERRAAGQRRDGVSSGYNVSLHRVLGGRRWIARNHRAFIERSLRAVAVVSADAENDCALLVHWVVARWAHTTVVR